ncbi:MAG: hypothetical protein JW776_06715 [Candidatus Lokiarchaeota archaeon]|nr:hypothetical protein [Candidatus Lokiarchaeota archaeon]
MKYPDYLAKCEFEEWEDFDEEWEIRRRLEDGEGVGRSIYLENDYPPNKASKVYIHNQARTILKTAFDIIPPDQFTVNPDLRQLFGYVLEYQPRFLERYLEDIIEKNDIGTFEPDYKTFMKDLQPLLDMVVIHGFWETAFQTHVSMHPYYYHDVMKNYLISKI